MEYLNTNYSKYLIDNNNARLIEIDLTKFKKINDNYGHEKGDDCLKFLSSTLKKLFPNSITIRRGGDEFVILTNKEKVDISRRMKIVMEAIETAHEINQIPTKFKFNCGVVDATENAQETLEKADVMMYDAKQNGKMITFYDEVIYDEFKNKEKFVNSIEESIKNGDIILISEAIYDLNKNRIVMNEINSKIKSDEKLFLNKNYDLLRKKFKLKKLDAYNLLKIATTPNLVNQNIMINLHNQTLFSTEKKFEEQIMDYLYINEMNPANIVLNINVEKIDYKMKELLEKIDYLKALDFKIGLDKLNNKSGDNINEIWQEKMIDYIKFDSEYWKSSKQNKKKEDYIKSMIELYSTYDTCSILSHVENADDEKQAMELGKKGKILVKGCKYGKEKVIK